VKGGAARFAKCHLWYRRPWRGRAVSLPDPHAAASFVSLLGLRRHQRRIAQVTPDVLALLGDGVPRSEAAIIAALAGRHSKDNVRRTVMRLAVLGQLAMQGSRYSLPAPGPAQG
jgi:hypothetical protein